MSDERPAPPSGRPGRSVTFGKRREGRALRFPVRAVRRGRVVEITGILLCVTGAFLERNRGSSADAGAARSGAPEPCEFRIGAEARGRRRQRSRWARAAVVLDQAIRAQPSARSPRDADRRRVRALPAAYAGPHEDRRPENRTRCDDVSRKDFAAIFHHWGAIVWKPVPHGSQSRQRRGSGCLPARVAGQRDRCRD
jgi:hypothetical protein